MTIIARLLYNVEDEILSLAEIKTRLYENDIKGDGNEGKISRLVSTTGQYYRPLANDKYGVYSAYYRRKIARPEQFFK